MPMRPRQLFGDSFQWKIFLASARISKADQKQHCCTQKCKPSSEARHATLSKDVMVFDAEHCDSARGRLPAKRLAGPPGCLFADPPRIAIRSYFRAPLSPFWGLVGS